MIYTVTFNPALDYVVWMDQLRPGQINRTASEEIQCGGKGINVSTVLTALGVENIALGFLAGFTGRALEEGLRSQGIRTDFIWLPEGLTRINVKVKGGAETEINGQGPAVGPVALRALQDKLNRLEAGDFLVISGSVPAALSHDVYEQILARLEDRGIQFVVDTTRDLLCSALPYHPFLIKPNSLELGELFGRTLENDEDTRACAMELQAKGARNVLVSMAGNGSLLLDERGGCHRLGVPKGTVRNSVGAGDSMVAGFLAGWLETGDYAYAQRLGAAAGSATAFSEGLATKEQVMALLHTF
ncbi:1-phosphofructokinase [uncultured Flavonifractor sp.]|uniref:1-phosphofructokinase n=1 Tax=uncultured Flavonifractor sp. TaxID=1193534 RepID=UPI0026122654|nr:1-phosphofructokinase [uncultured Flavonifractor sp.]